jgi:hypothetical protein
MHDLDAGDGVRGDQPSPSLWISVLTEGPLGSREGSTRLQGF